VTRVPDARPGPLPQSVWDVAALLAGDTATTRAFLGGLVAGALVGAAIAGTSLVRSRLGPPETRRDSPANRR
jgi:hypothetical protein